MCTQLSPKVPSINQFLVMPTAEILELPVNKCPPSELYKGIAHQINHPVINQILALKYFVNRFNDSPERVELYDTVVPRLKDSLCELLQSPQLDTICAVIDSVTLAICDTVDSTCEDSSKVLQSLAIGVLDLLLQLYRRLFERRDNDIESVRLNSILKCVNVIRAKLLDHLKSNEDNFLPLPEDFTNNDATFVNRVIFLLCEMAEFAFKAEDAPFMVAVWRCIVAVCSGKLPKSIERLAVKGDESNYFEFLLSAVKTGCLCIQCGLDGMRESSSEHSHQLYNKTITFITSVFQRLATVYSHDKFRGHHHIVTTLVTMMRTKRTQPDAFLEQNLVSGLQNVLLLICKCDEFVECFRRISSDDFSIELLRIGRELSKKLLDDTDPELLRSFMKNEHVNVIDKMVECMTIDPSSSIFGESHAYHKTIETLSSILIKCSAPTSIVNPNIVPRLLAKNLLQCNDILQGYIWMDLFNGWITCLSEEQRYNLIRFWSEINTKLSAVQSNHSASANVKILLRNLYDGLTSSYKQRLSSDKRILNNVKFWVALGLQRRECEANETTNVDVKVDQLLKTFLDDRTDAAFYKMIEHLRLLETTPSKSTVTPVPNWLIELWNLNLNHRPKKFAPLIVTLIRISITHRQSLDNGQHLHILQKLSAIVNSPSVTICLQLEVLHYLRHVTINFFTVEHQKEILLAIRKLFRKGFVAPDPIVRRAAFTTYTKVISEAKHDDIQPDNITDDANELLEWFDFMKLQMKKSSADQQIKFLRQLSSRSIQHDCAGVTLPPSNGTSTDGHSNDVRIKQLIDRMRDDAEELLALNRRNRLTDEFCKCVASIRKELASLE